MTTVLAGGEGSASRPGRSLPPGKTRYPVYRRLGGSQGRSEQVRKISPPIGIRSPDRPARSQSLCRLSYRAHVSCYRLLQMLCSDPSVTINHTLTNSLQFSYILEMIKRPNGCFFCKLCTPWWLSQWGPKNVTVCVLKHYCDSNELCAFVGLHCTNES